LVESKRSAGFLCDPPDLVNPHGVQVNDYLPTKDKQQAWTDLDFGGKYGVGILGHVRKQKRGTYLLRSVYNCLTSTSLPSCCGWLYIIKRQRIC
jgi:hypothetical protein